MDPVHLFINLKIDKFQKKTDFLNACLVLHDVCDFYSLGLIYNPEPPPEVPSTYWL